MTEPGVVDGAFDEVEGFGGDIGAVEDVAGGAVGVLRTAVDGGALLKIDVLEAGAVDNVVLVVAGAPDEVEVHPESSKMAAITTTGPLMRISDTPRLGPPE